MALTAVDAIKATERLADTRQAAIFSRFFKTAPGDYGEGDHFLGLNVPQVRAVAKTFRNLPLSEVLRLLRHRSHEVRLLALLIMVDQHERGDAAQRQRIFDGYLANTRFINNWDLVDVSSPSIVGPHVSGNDLHLLELLAESPLLWERRIAMLATHYGIRRGAHGPALRIAKRLLSDDHDLMHKAVGWMLREVGKRDLAALEGFLQKHGTRMPRTALRYAVERFPQNRRLKYLRALAPALKRK